MIKMNVQKCTLCVCVLTLILVCVLVYRNVNEGFISGANKPGLEEVDPTTAGSRVKSGERVAAGRGCRGPKTKVERDIVAFSKEVTNFTTVKLGLTSVQAEIANLAIQNPNHPKMPQLLARENKLLKDIGDIKLDLQRRHNLMLNLKNSAGGCDWSRIQIPDLPFYE